MKNVVKYLHTNFNRLYVKIKQFFCHHYWFIYTNNEPVRFGGYGHTTIVFSPNDARYINEKYGYNLFPRFSYRFHSVEAYNVFCYKCKKEIMYFDENNKFLAETKEAAKAFLSSKKS